MQNKIPNSIEDDSQEGDTDRLNMDMNRMSWSSATKEFTNDDKTMTIVLVDYMGATSMYNGFAMAWSNDVHFENEETITGTTTVTGYKGFESYDKKEKISTLVLGVFDSYYVSVQADET